MKKYYAVQYFNPDTSQYENPRVVEADTPSNAGRSVAPKVMPHSRNYGKFRAFAIKSGEKLEPSYRRQSKSYWIALTRVLANCTPIKD